MGVSVFCSIYSHLPLGLPRIRPGHGSATITQSAFRDNSLTDDAFSLLPNLPQHREVHPLIQEALQLLVVLLVVAEDT